MKIEVSKFINAPIDRVFDVFADIGRITERISAITKVEILSEAKSGVGTRWRETRVIFGKEATEEMEITELQHNRSYVVEAESNGTHYRSEYTFTEKDGGTLVNMTFEGKPLTFMARAFGLLMFAFIGMTKKMLETDMDELKKLLEG